MNTNVQNRLLKSLLTLTKLVRTWHKPQARQYKQTENNFPDEIFVFGFRKSTFWVSRIAALLQFSAIFAGLIRVRQDRAYGARDHHQTGSYGLGMQFETIK